MKLKHLALALSSIGMLSLAVGVSAQEIKKEDAKKKKEICETAESKSNYEKKEAEFELQRVCAQNNTLLNKFK